MSTKSKYTGTNLGFFDSALNPDFPAGVWADCPLLAAMQDPNVGHDIFEDFNDIDAATLAGWTATQATTGTFALADAAGGVALADANSTTQGQGINVQKLGESITPAAGKNIWFEARVKVADTFDKAELFIGLSVTDTTILVTQANTSTDHIGWQCVTNDGILLFSAEKGGVGATKVAAPILEDTWINLGFKVNGLDTIEHWAYGAKIGTTHLTANIPIVELTPSFVCQSGGTNDPILHIDWVKCFQIR
jgi:hypothetical protein